MTDITDVVDRSLKEHNAHVNYYRRTCSDITDEFLKEAYRINANIFSVYAYLRSVRQSYLSTSLPSYRSRFSTDRNISSKSKPTAAKDRRYFTDIQRDQIDAQSKSTLRDLNAIIQQLEEAEQLRRETEITLAKKWKARRGFKTIGQWAAGAIYEPQSSREEALEIARQETVGLHRESVIWYLRKKLGEAADLQSGMTQKRLEREVEKSKSMLYKTKGGWLMDNGLSRSGMGLVSGTTNGTEQSKLNGGGSLGGPSTLDNLEKGVEQTLSPEQLQLFAQENSNMLKHYEDTLDKVRTAERSMVEISELQSTLATSLETQSTMINDLVLESLETRNDVAGGNRELTRAAERKGPARWVFRATCGLCVCLILWDFFI